jgi:hypothetical protein
MIEDTEQPASEDAGSDAISLEDRIANKMAGPDEPEPPEVDEDTAPEAVETTETPSDSEEIEFEGLKFSVPKVAKDAFMRDRDYTQKTQELARQRQLLDVQFQQNKAVMAERAFDQSIADEQRELSNIDAQLNQYANVDLRQLSGEDTQRALLEINQLRTKQESLSKSLQTKRGEFESAMRSHRQTLIQQGQDYLRKVIPAWNEQLAKTVTDHAITDGYSREEVGGITDPRMVRTLWKAQQYDALQAQKQATTQKVASAPPIVKPAAVQAVNRAKGEFLNFRKSLAQAKSPQERQSVIEARFAQKIR